jgi:hypothetical protein
MQLDQARDAFKAGQLSEAVIEPADEGNGWMILVRRHQGELVKITDAHGSERIYHSLDHATEAAKGIGFDSVRVEEAF